MHRRQVHRDPWPDFDAFEPERYPIELRRPAAHRWMRRAREEHGSVHEFTALTHGLTGGRAPLHVLGSLARLITDEVRHAEMCARMAVACLPEAADDDELFEWPAPGLPWPAAPETQDDRSVRRWAAEAVLSSCCIGETLSRPLFEAAATVTTDPVCEAVLRQILRDEHLHAAFGWEALAVFMEPMPDEDRGWLQARLAARLGRFERSCAAGLDLADLAGTEVVIEPGDPAHPNLAILTRRQYATVFYATVESEILPRFTALGLDGPRAWAQRAAA